MEPTLPIYVGWATLGSNLTIDPSGGTTGSAYCTPVSARYDYTVRLKNPHHFAFLIQYLIYDALAFLVPLGQNHERRSIRLLQRHDPRPVNACAGYRNIHCRSSNCFDSTSGTASASRFNILYIQSGHAGVGLGEGMEFQFECKVGFILEYYGKRYGGILHMGGCRQRH